MKLLDKKTIAVEKSTERSREVQEGLKLAKSVDSLRDTLAKEQNTLKKFRDATLKSIKDEVDVLLEQKNTLVKELEGLETRKKEALIPVDDEWVKISIRNEELRDLQSILDDRQLEIKQKELDYEIRFRELTVEEQRIKDVRTFVSQKLFEAELMFKEAEQLSDATLEKNSRITKELEKRQKELKVKENEVRFKEVDINNIKDKLDIKEKQLVDYERAINDKYQTLIRAQKHI